MAARVGVVVAADCPEVEHQDVTDYLLTELAGVVGLDPADERLPGVLLLLADRYAGRRRAQALALSPQYSYRRSDVAVLLETVWDRARWLRGHVPQDARSRRGEMDAVEVHADVSEALMGLSRARRYRLWRHYCLGDDSHPLDADRALTDLTDALNDYRRKRC